MFLKISQELSGITRDCKFFCREKLKPVFLSPATSANRPAELAKSAIFDDFQKIWPKKQKNQKSLPKKAFFGQGVAFLRYFHQFLSLGQKNIFGKNLELVKTFELFIGRLSAISGRN